MPILAVFWLVLSGHFEPLPLTLGALSVAIVCWMAGGRRFTSIPT